MNINIIILVLSDLFLLLILATLIKEKEKKGALISLVILLLNSVIWLAFYRYFYLSVIKIINYGLISLLAILVVISLVRFFPKRAQENNHSIERFDERNHMFARNNLKFHPKLAAQYYQEFPHNREIDNKIHKKKELHEQGHTYYDEFYTPVFDAAFSYLSKTKSALRGDINKKHKAINKEKLTEVLQQIARYYGAADLGITELRPYHLYTKKGRSADEWNSVVKNNHKFAIVIIVAMDFFKLKKAPSLPVILESSKQYVESAKIASILAEYLRILGYDSRAHSDGNYETLCVPLGVDSGLGELGRLGLLVHKKYGPCIRISVVTTSAELVVSSRKKLRVNEFCRICKKCSQNCPTGSIPSGDEPYSRGFKHWSINQETCFSFWKNIGTDCGFCISSCPYTKPDTFFHRLVRFYITANPINQRIALFFDDLFYGRKLKIPGKNPREMLSGRP